jgi:pimeloyl-ACP methyl ester carboxylesterase
VAANLPDCAARPVVALDLLGEPGRSVQTRPITDAADQAQWLVEAFRRARPAIAPLLGMSIGGWSAVNLAVRHPDLVASVSTLDPATHSAGSPTGGPHVGRHAAVLPGSDP